MPAKKTAKKSAKKTAKKAAGKTGKIAKKVKKTTASAGEKRSTETKSKPKKTAVVKKENLIDCVHCDGSGRCSGGQPYDKDRHQSIFKEILLISCTDCLSAAGKSRKSKKMVKCRICQGTGKVEKT